MIGLARQYKAHEDVVDTLRGELSSTLLSAGVVSERLNDYDNSLKLYAKAIEVNPGNARAYFNRSVIYWKRGDWGSVVSDLENAVRIDPNFKEAGYYLAQARARLNRK
jgi:tetratricopeptide (TPR) repeat protein